MGLTKAITSQVYLQIQADIVPPSHTVYR